MKKAKTAKLLIILAMLDVGFVSVGQEARSGKPIKEEAESEGVVSINEINSGNTEKDSNFNFEIMAGVDYYNNSGYFQPVGFNSGSEVGLGKLTRTGDYYGGTLSFEMTEAVKIQGGKNHLRFGVDLRYAQGSFSLNSSRALEFSGLPLPLPYSVNKLDEKLFYGRLRLDLMPTENIGGFLFTPAFGIGGGQVARNEEAGFSFNGLNLIVSESTVEDTFVDPGFVFYLGLPLPKIIPENIALTAIIDQSIMIGNRDLSVTYSDPFNIRSAFGTPFFEDNNFNSSQTFYGAKGDLGLRLIFTDVVNEIMNRKRGQEYDAKFDIQLEGGWRYSRTFFTDYKEQITGPYGRLGIRFSF